MGDLPDWMQRAHQRATQRYTPEPPALTFAQAPRTRPTPRQMRPPSLRANDPNQGVRRQAEREIAMTAMAQADPRTEPRLPTRNQFADTGQAALEATGLPSIRRGTADVTRGAMNADPNEGLRQTGAGAFELGMGGLGVAGLGVAPRMAPRLPARAAQALPEPMPRMTPPPREIASNGMTIRPAEPFRNSMRGGSEDLAEAALFRGSNTGGTRGRWATPDASAAADYGSVSSANFAIKRPLNVSGWGDLEEALGDRVSVLGRMDETNADVWDALELPEVQSALRAQGYDAVNLADDISPAGRRHSSVLSLAPPQAPDAGDITARAPTLPAQGVTRPQAQGTSPAMAPPPRRGMFGRMDRPGVRDMQPEGIY